MTSSYAPPALAEQSWEQVHLSVDLGFVSPVLDARACETLPSMLPLAELKAASLPVRASQMLFHVPGLTDKCLPHKRGHSDCVRFCELKKRPTWCLCVRNFAATSGSRSTCSRPSADLWASRNPPVDPSIVMVLGAQRPVWNPNVLF